MHIDDDDEGGILIEEIDEADDELVRLHMPVLVDDVDVLDNDIIDEVFIVVSHLTYVQLDDDEVELDENEHDLVVI